MATKPAAPPTMADRVVASATPKNIGGGIGLAAGGYLGWQMGYSMFGPPDGFLSKAIAIISGLAFALFGVLLGNWAGENLQQPAIDGGKWLGDTTKKLFSSADAVPIEARTVAAAAAAVTTTGKPLAAQNVSLVSVGSFTSSLAGVSSIPKPTNLAMGDRNARGGMGA